MTGRIEVIARVSGRRFWTIEQKLAMLRDAFGPGGSVRRAMERHEVSSGLLYTWRSRAMSGQLLDPPPKTLARLGAPPSPSIPAPPGPAFAEVRVDEAVSLAAPSPTPALPAPPSPEAPGRIGIELPSGVRLSVDAAVDVDALGRVLGVLQR